MASVPDCTKLGTGCLFCSEQLKADRSNGEYVAAYLQENQKSGHLKLRVLMTVYQKKADTCKGV